MAYTYPVQHAQKRAEPGDPGLTALGELQAARTAHWLSRAGLGALFCSPLRPARRTAEFIAAATGLEICADDRLRERMNWDGSQPIEEFLGDWARTAQDRDVQSIVEQTRRPAQV